MNRILPAMSRSKNSDRQVTRRALLTALSSSAVVAATASYTLSYMWTKPANAAQWENPGDMAVGNPEAPVVAIEYFSLTCGHCLKFHRDTYAAFRRDFVETGKVRYILRDFPLNIPALNAAKLAHCGGQERYFAFVETLFAQFEQWTSASDYIDALTKIGELGGVSEADFKACMADKQLEARLLSIALDGEQKYNVASTPSFVINGKLYEGAMKIDKFAEILNAFMPKS